MSYLIVAVIVIAGLAFALRGFLHADPKRLARLVRLGGGGVVIAVGVFFTLRGNFLIGPPMVIFGFGLIGRELGLSGLGGRSGFPGWGGRSPGQRSSVRTRVLAMELDHDSGEMDGDVLTGTLAGARLSALSLQDLQSLYAECEAVGDQSAQLLEAYLDRAHPGWRGGGDGAAREEERARPGEGTRSSGTDAMTREEAYSILGLEPGASDTDVRAAHRRLMKQFHPDRGGSSYLAAKVNQAKDMLLGKRR